jgi:vitamin B12 transporter
VAQQAPSWKESVVVTATGDEARLDDVPAATSVITAEDLRAAGAFQLADALRRVAGSVLLRSGLDNGVISLFVRGVSPTQTLVLFDGVRLNSPFFGGYDFSLPLTLGLDRVEVVRGPYSALYGADAVGGVVQLVPARASASRFQAYVEGGEAWRRGEIQAALRGNGIDVNVAAGARAGDGPLPNDGFSTTAVLLSIASRLGDQGKLSLVLDRTSSMTEIPFSGALATPNRSTDADQTVLALPLRLRLGPGQELEAVASYVTSALAYRDPDDASGFVRGDTSAESRALRVAYHTTLGRHRLLVGGEWRQDTVSDGSNFGVTVDGQHVVTRAVFVQDGWRFTQQWSLLAGARWDEAEPWGAVVSPRATLAWSEGGARAWLAYGHAFRAPGLGELYYPFSGNRSLRPERSNSAELGVAVPLAGGRSAVQITVFANEQRNLIDFDLGSYRFENIARARQRGLELALLVAPTRAGEIEASVNYWRTSDEAGQSLLRRPAWSGAVSWRGRVQERVEGYAALIYVGARADADPVSLQRVQQGGFVTASLSAALKLTAALSARVRLENIANHAYEEVRGYPAPGRRVLLGLETLLQ